MLACVCLCLCVVVCVWDRIYVLGFSVYTTFVPSNFSTTYIKNISVHTHLTHNDTEYKPEIQEYI